MFAYKGSHLTAQGIKAELLYKLPYSFTFRVFTYYFILFSEVYCNGLKREILELTALLSELCDLGQII